jgi:hypothetical protein
VTGPKPVTISSESFVQILDRLDEVGPPDDHIQLLRLLNRCGPQLDLVCSHQA